MDSETHMPARIAVIGSGACGPEVAKTAERLGELLADAGFEIVCGGMGGVMTAVCQGARSRGGRTIGIVHGGSRQDANEYVEIAVATDMGQMRNFLVVLNGDVVVAVEGGAGTLSEVGHALKMGKKVVAMGHWADLPGVIPVAGPEEALLRVRELLPKDKKKVRE